MIQYYILKIVLALHSRELCGMQFSSKHSLRFIYKNYEKVIIFLDQILKYIKKNFFFFIILSKHGY